MKYFKTFTDNRVKVEWELCVRNDVPVGCVTNVSNTLDKLSSADIAEITDGLELPSLFVDKIRVTSCGDRIVVSRFCRIDVKPDVITRLKAMDFTELL
jgi:hypothetical protein